MIPRRPVRRAAVALTVWLALARLAAHAAPNIDALARSGVRFTQGYMSAPMCSPTQAGLLTGRNQAGFGCDDNPDDGTPGFDPDFAGLNVKERTTAMLRFSPEPSACNRAIHESLRCLLPYVFKIANLQNGQGDR